MHRGLLSGISVDHRSSARGRDGRGLFSLSAAEGVDDISWRGRTRAPSWAVGLEICVSSKPAEKLMFSSEDERCFIMAWRRALACMRKSPWVALPPSSASAVQGARSSAEASLEPAMDMAVAWSKLSFALLLTEPRIERLGCNTSVGRAGVCGESRSLLLRSLLDFPMESTDLRRKGKEARVLGVSGYLCGSVVSHEAYSRAGGADVTPLSRVNLMTTTPKRAGCREGKAGSESGLLHSPSGGSGCSSSLYVSGRDE